MMNRKIIMYLALLDVNSSPAAAEKSQSSSVNVSTYNLEGGWGDAKGQK